MIYQSKLQEYGIISKKPVNTVIDLGMHAYADTFVPVDRLGETEPIFPLQVALDADAGHLQLRYVSPARDRYNLYSYSYTSSNSATSRKHWDDMADYLKNQYPIQDLVVEIGSNDGYLIQQFKDVASDVIGIDSSKLMSDSARDRGVTAWQEEFGPESVAKIRKTGKRVTMILANNVFNHANDPLAFARAVAEVLDPQGVFVFEVPSWQEMMRAGRFPDMIYHEHVSYFTVKSVVSLLRSAGLTVRTLDLVDYHGGSLRVVAELDRGMPMSDDILSLIQQEERFGLFQEEYYQDRMREWKQHKNRWLKDFFDLRLQHPDSPVIGVGAAAKANTWLTWHGLDNSVISAITDSSEHKQGKYTPLTRIPILGDDEFTKHPEPLALILSWNIGDNLRKALSAINPNTKFISQ